MAGKLRAPHKEGCMCAVCKAKAAKIIQPPVANAMRPLVTRVERILPPDIPEVRLDTLPSKAKFTYQGREHRVGEKIEGYVVAYNLFSQSIVTLGSATLVKPVK